MSASFDPGVPGSSARREQARRKANRERRIREKHPLIGGALVAFQETPRHERNWSRGAGGEECVARILARRLDDAVVLLHDRRIPRSRANIDHIAVAPSGVWVIDSKRYQGKVSVTKPLVGRTKLMIAGRDKTTLIDALRKQVTLVASVVEELAPGLPLHGSLCFVEAELPVLRKLEFDGYPLLYPKALAKRINARGQLANDRVDALARGLAERFPAAGG